MLDVARFPALLPLLVGCGSAGGQTVDQTDGMPAGPGVTTADPDGGSAGATAGGASAGGASGAMPDAPGSAGNAPGPTANAGDGGEAGSPDVPIEAVEPLVTCELGTFYCNGACLSEVGEQVGTCRIVYADPSPFAALAEFLLHDGRLFIPHDWGVASVDLSNLSVQPLAEGFDRVRHLQVDGDLLYIAGARAEVPSVWTVPVAGGDLTSVGLDGSEVEWFHIYRGVLYHRVSVTREVKTMRMLDLASGVVEDIPTPHRTAVFASGYAYLPGADSLSRAPIDQITDSAQHVRVAETEGVIGGVYAVGDAVYYTSDAAPQSILWRMDNSATAPERIAQLPGPTYGLFDGHHLLGTCPTFESTQTFWTIPLDGGELTKVTELDACDSAVTSRSVDSSLAAGDVYHAQKSADGGTHLVSAIIEVERP